MTRSKQRDTENAFNRLFSASALFDDKSEDIMQLNEPRHQCATGQNQKTVRKEECTNFKVHRANRELT